MYLYEHARATQEPLYPAANGSCFGVSMPWLWLTTLRLPDVEKQTPRHAQAGPKVETPFFGVFA